MTTDTTKHRQDGSAPLRLHPDLLLMPRDMTLAEAVVVGALLEAAAYPLAAAWVPTYRTSTSLATMWLGRN